MLFIKSISLIISVFNDRSYWTSFYDVHNFCNISSLCLSNSVLDFSTSSLVTFYSSFCYCLDSINSCLCCFIRFCKSSATVIFKEIVSFRSLIYLVLWDITLSCYINFSSIFVLYSFISVCFSCSWSFISETSSLAEVKSAKLFSFVILGSEISSRFFEYFELSIFNSFNYSLYDVYKAASFFLYLISTFLNISICFSNSSF